MASQHLPSPTTEAHKPSLPRKKTTSSSSKSVKPSNRASKRASISAAAVHHHDHIAQSAGGATTTTGATMDGRHKRVWKACERCRMKKTKCDGEFPCKRCKDDGLVCTAGVRKKVEYKQLPRGYAEVLENTQFALIATVHKLYSMVRQSQPWELGEPELNERGQPVIHDIAQRLGCIRPNSDIDLPVHSVFPEDESAMVELVRQLEEHQRDVESQREQDSTTSCTQTSDRASSTSDIEQSDFEHDYRKLAFGRHNSMVLSPQSYARSESFEFPSSTHSSGTFSTPSPTVPQQPAWLNAPMDDMAMHFITQAGAMVPNMDLLSQGYVESDFGTIKPHMLSCPNPEVMMGMGDPMIFSGYEEEPMRL